MIELKYNLQLQSIYKVRAFKNMMMIVEWGSPTLHLFLFFLVPFYFSSISLFMPVGLAPHAHG